MADWAFIRKPFHSNRHLLQTRLNLTGKYIFGYIGGSPNYVSGMDLGVVVLLSSLAAASGKQY